MDATEARIAAAHRRKILAQREQQFKRQQEKLKREVNHRELAWKRQHIAKEGTDPITSRLYYSAAGSGSSWRAREQINLKNSPQNARRKSTWSDNDDDEVEEIERLMKLTRKLHEEEEKDNELGFSQRRERNSPVSGRDTPRDGGRRSPIVLSPSPSSAETDQQQLQQQQLQQKRADVEELERTLKAASSFKIEKKKKKEIRPISAKFYERLSTQKTKQSRAEADEFMY